MFCGKWLLAAALLVGAVAKPRTRLPCDSYHFEDNQNKCDELAGYEVLFGRVVNCSALRRTISCYMELSERTLCSPRKSESFNAATKRHLELCAPTHFGRDNEDTPKPVKTPAPTRKPSTTKFTLVSELLTTPEAFLEEVTCNLPRGITTFFTCIEHLYSLIGEPCTAMTNFVLCANKAKNACTKSRELFSTVSYFTSVLSKLRYNPLCEPKVPEKRPRPALPGCNIHDAVRTFTHCGFEYLNDHKDLWIKENRPPLIKNTPKLCEAAKTLNHCRMDSIKKVEKCEDKSDLEMHLNDFFDLTSNSLKKRCKLY